MTEKPTDGPTKEKNKNQVLLAGNGNKTNGSSSFPQRRTQFGLAMVIFGYLVFLLGARPGLFHLDRSRVIGFVQISVFLIGLGMIVLGSYLTLNAFWPNGKKTIAADLGSRVISTGYVICVFTAMADIFGLGSHRLPDVFFGPLQARGVAIGMATIAVGFLLLIRYRHPEDEPTRPVKVKQAKEKKAPDQQAPEKAPSPPSDQS
jgi:hypothetical protein